MGFTLPKKMIFGMKKFGGEPPSPPLTLESELIIFFLNEKC